MIRLDEINLASDVTVCDNALAKHNISVLRDKDTPSEVFRMATRRLARLILTEAVKDLPLKTVTIETPLVKTESQTLDPEYEIIVAPILRAALTFSEVLQDLIPTAKVYHIGLYRDEDTLKPVSYYNKLPETLKDPKKVIVFVLDPMFATGGSAIEAVNIFRQRNIPEDNIHFVSLIAAPEGVKKFKEVHPNVKLVTGCVDKQLNEKGYILPGLGDAGDRTFNT